MLNIFLINYGAVFDDAAYANNECSNQLIIYDNHLKDDATKLAWHAWDEDGSATWADPTTHLSPEIWCRGLGWYVVACNEVLEKLPVDHPNRQAIINILIDRLQGIKNYQDSITGLWYQIMDKGDLTDNWVEESSACLFTYAMSKSIDAGYVSNAQYDTAVKEGYEGILSNIELDTAGQTILYGTCQGTGVQDSYSLYVGRAQITNDFHGQGSFLFANEQQRTKYTDLRQLYQVEKGTLYHAVTETTNRGFTGASYVNFDNEVGSYIEMTVNTTSAESTILIIRYANGTVANRPMKIYVNDNVVSNSLSFIPTGAFSAWKQQTISVSLNAGDNVIKFESIVDMGGPNIDWIALDSTAGIISLSLIPTCQSIGVYCNFSDDANENNQAILEYRASGTTQWLTAPPLTVDRRDTVVSDGSTVSNPYQNQYRGSVLFLDANTAYDVRVTYTDPDGGSGTVEGTITTLDDNPPSTGNTYYVAKTGKDNPANDGSYDKPWLTIQHAAGNVIAGDTVRILPGTYNEQVSLSVSGNANNYITFRSHDPNDRAIIESSERGTFSLTDISYIRLKELDIKGNDNDASCVFIQGPNSNGNIVEDCNLSSVGENWWAGGVIINGEGWSSGPTNTLIQRNYISTSATATTDEGPFGILLNRTDGGTVIRNNTIIGGFYDGIGGAPNFGINGGPYHDSDICDNYIEGVIDDGIESEGGNINVRIWGNEIRNPQTIGIAIGSTIIGPVHIFRNTIQEFPDAAFKMGHKSTGTTYIYHNTIYTSHTNGCGPTDFAGFDGIGNVISRNNIYQVGRYVIETIGPDLGGNSYDYDNMFTTDPTRFVKWHSDNYTSPAIFQTGTGQELHAISADSEFIDPINNDLTLKSTSPCIDQGVILPGFNDADSPWPYHGSAPDLGAYEASENAATQVPIVTTDSAPSIGATTATVNGTIMDDGGGSCLYRFEYDTDPGEPYAYNTGWIGNKTTDQSFSANLTGLNPETPYYFRAQARNSVGTSSGDELSFTTTLEYISFTVTDYGSDGIEFGIVDPGESDHPADWGGGLGAVTITVGSETNVNVNVQLKGTDFTGPDTISISNVKYNNTDSLTGANILTTTYITWYTVTQFLGENNIVQVYFWITVPGGIPPGIYTSIFTYRAEAVP